LLLIRSGWLSPAEYGWFDKPEFQVAMVARYKHSKTGAKIKEYGCCANRDFDRDNSII